MASPDQKTLLVVDDTSGNLLFMNELLSPHYRVKIANSGEKALRIARSDSPPDLILLDIMMPEMNGYDVCRQLKASPMTSDIPVIFLTALTDADDEQHGLELGAVDYISKPIKPSVVLARIKTHLALKEMSDFLRDKNEYLKQEVQQRIREERKTFQFNQQIIYCAQEGIVVLDTGLRFKVWNPFMERLTGVSASEVIGRHPRDVFPFMETSGDMEQIAQALSGTETPGLEHSFTIPQTGRSGWTYTVSSPLSSESGEIIGVIRMVRDITEQKLLQDQLRQSQKMEGIGQLASGVAHDFNNVLQVVFGYGSLLTIDDQLTGRQREYVEEILTASEKAAQLIKGLLAFGRKQVMAPKRVNLNDIVDHVKKFLVRVIGEDIRLTLYPGQVSLPVIVDGGQIEQVLINLATNARDAMPSGGVLSIETGRQLFEEPLVCASGTGAPGEYAWISVTDTGSGMDAAVCQKIFEPFFTTKEAGKGTGLGMAIVYGIVSQHKGFICIDSQPGQGTTFRIYLPIAAAEPEALPEKSVSEPTQGGGETILLVEDDEIVRELMESLLTGHGYRVITAFDGVDAVEKFAARSESIDLTILDMIMPRKSGSEALVDIRHIRPDAAFLFMSGYAADVLTQRGMESKGVAMLQKPVQTRELLQAIRELLPHKATA